MLRLRDVEKGIRSFAIDPAEVADHKQKWYSAIVRQVMGNNAFYFLLQHEELCGEEMELKRLLEVQRIEKDMFVFRFQSEESKQIILKLFPMPFRHRVLCLWP